MSADAASGTAPRIGPARPRSRRARGAAGARRPVYDVASLLAVAVAEFNTRGYDATSMEDLSRAAGITKSSFYHHVSGKEELLRAALERSLDGLFAILDERHATSGRPVDRLRYIVRRQVEVLQAELPYVTLLLRVRGNTETERWALERRRSFDAAIAELVREAAGAGQVRADVDPAVAAKLLSGTVNSIVEWYRPGRPGADALPEDVVRTVFEGVLARD
ncbi:TetR/AcrR family transcriptional regulator [Pseudonocardia asaccharolytica]|nr:TetR/AcrR family transcriptional regulator [Pseudonocardia asaccharolytica]